MKHVLALSTLYPNPANPRFGTFVARSLEALARHGTTRGGQRVGADTGRAEHGEWRVTVINPIGLPPLGLAALSPRYRELDDLPERASEGGIEVHRPRFGLIPKLGARRNAAAIARAVLPLARAIHAHTPVDVVSAQFFFPDGPAAARIAQALERPLSIKARGSDITYWGTVAAARAQMLEAAGAAQGLLAVSAALADEMAALGLAPRAAIHVHYTGLDRDRFRPLGHTQLRAQLGTELGFTLPPTAPLFASVGALVERKGHAITLAALAQLSAQQPEARLLVVGRGEEERSLRQLAGELGLSDRVHFTGAVDHDILPLILSAADAMVLPSANEGLANAWVEALACGTPLVTCDVGGARELVTSPLAGQLVERTPEAVAAGMAAVLADPPERQAVAALVEAFDWVTHAAQLAAHFERLCGQD